jgi:cytosine deaminase
MQLVIRNGRLAVPGASPEGLVDLLIDEGRFAAVERAGVRVDDVAQEIDVSGAMLSPPYVEPHVHMDTCLTAGEPRWNESGTLWEGIACWSERKAMLTHDDVVARVNEVLRWQVANGVLHVRSHVDTTDPSLIALDALIEVRERVRDVVNLQLVAFPQEGIVSFPDGDKLIAEAARRGVDAIGAIPHFEDTRDDGVRSLEIAVSTALEAGLLIDVHCDEIDDEQSRFVEVLATHAMRTGHGQPHDRDGQLQRRLQLQAAADPVPGRHQPGLQPDGEPPPPRPLRRLSQTAGVDPGEGDARGRSQRGLRP